MKLPSLDLTSAVRGVLSASGPTTPPSYLNSKTVTGIKPLPNGTDSGIVVQISGSGTMDHAYWSRPWFDGTKWSTDFGATYSVSPTWNAQQTQTSTLQAVNLIQCG